MAARKLSNLSLADYCSFLKLVGCQLIRTKGGHDVFARVDLLRPVVVQNHIDPVPERIIRQGLRALNMSKSDLFDILDGRKEVVRKSSNSNVFVVQPVKKG